jgi:hypothetical protein
MTKVQYYTLVLNQQISEGKAPEVIALTKQLLERLTGKRW